ncbi:unnamed protein product [Lactuca virosa]|uniref:Uncharacterized protein n=1 Tax=Lactuca virosa TaxID=75947 RepID=A0AAU9N0T2_9ASTR|nr:unnamed protein product [Lactuca virosa]
MQLLRVDERDVYWQVEGEYYLHIDSRNRQLLTLTYPLSDMILCLNSILGVVMPGANVEPNAYEPIPDALVPDVAMSVQQEHVMHPHHDMYMQEFQHLLQFIDASIMTIPTFITVLVK